MLVKDHFSGLVHDWGISIANAMEIQQFAPSDQFYILS